MRKYTLLVKETEKKYGIQVKSYLRTTRGFDNLNLILTATDGKKYVLRRFLWPPTNINDLKERLKLKTLLAEKSFLCRRILKDQKGEYFFHYQNRFNALFSYIDAKNPSIYQIRKYNDKLASLIGDLHIITKDFKVEFNKTDWTIPTDEVLKVYNNVKKNNFWGMAKNDLLAVAHFYIKLFQMNDGLPRGLIHGDVVEGNVLIDKLQNVYLIDFDNIHEDYLLKDLCFPIESAFLEYRRWTPSLGKRLKEIISAYDRKRPLLKIEKQNILNAIKRDLLTNAVWFIYDWHKGRKKSIRARNMAKRRILSYFFLEKEKDNFQKVIDSL